SAREEAALQWAEEVTRVSETHASDEAFAAVSADFQPKVVSDLTIAIGLINLFNRLAISLRRPPGSSPRNAVIAATVAAGCSSISQWPELAMTWPVTSLATKRSTSAWVVPNDLSAPIASTGMASLPLAAKDLLSTASCVEAANCSKAECMPPGRP